MSRIHDSSVDMVLCDLPYGTTANKWDSIISLPELWKQYKRVCKSNAAIILTASQPFTSILVTSNLSMFKHEWIWQKNRGSNFANTVREPMKEHESILVFSKGGWTYNKQMQNRTGGGVGMGGAHQKEKGKTKIGGVHSDNFNDFAGKDIVLTEQRVPSSWQKWNTENGLHPTQKPVEMFRYLIRTYSNPSDVILDNCIGSGTTAVAAWLEGRQFIGIEKEQRYVDIANDRLIRLL